MKVMGVYPVGVLKSNLVQKLRMGNFFHSECFLEGLDLRNVHPVLDLEAMSMGLVALIARSEK